jgi:hypothetical protein
MTEHEADNRPWTGQPAARRAVLVVLAAASLVAGACRDSGAYGGTQGGAGRAPAPGAPTAGTTPRPTTTPAR